MSNPLKGKVLIDAYHADKHGPGQGFTPLESFVDQYLTERWDSGEVRRATIDQYRHSLSRVFLPWATDQGFTEPTQIDDKAMRQFVESLRERTRTVKGSNVSLSDESIRTYVRATRLFLTWAHIPKGRFRQPKRPERDLEILTREEIDLMEKAARDERDRLIVRVLADTGVRAGELLALRLSDLRENTHDRVYGIYVSGKTSKSGKAREVPLTAPVFKRLRNFAEGQRGEYIFMARRRRKNGELERLTPSGLAQLIRGLAKDAKITGKRVYPHIFRHSYISNALIRGVNPVVLQKVVGHSSLAMISTTYAHFIAPDTYEAMVRVLT